MRRDKITIHNHYIAMTNYKKKPGKKKGTKMRCGNRQGCIVTVMPTFQPVKPITLKAA